MPDLTPEYLDALEAEHPLYSHQNLHHECGMYPCLVQQAITRIRELEAELDTARHALYGIESLKEDWRRKAVALEARIRAADRLADA